jgi:phospholipid-binding lipoprotein MlaA
VGPSSSRVTQWALIAVLAFGFGGCAGLARNPSNPAFSDAEAPPPLLASLDYTLLAQQTTSTGARKSDEAEIEEYDPWEPFNEKIFAFNHALDRHVVKPVAKAYDRVVPDRAQQVIENGFDNLRFAPRFVNNLLQGKLIGAARELGRFLINSTIGIGGLLDRAKTEFGIEKSKEDFGQTLGVWGFGPGPYLVLPLLPPMTVRDGIGLGVDGVLDPLGFYVPFIWDRFGMKVGDTINDRSMNLELFQGFEETTVDLYSAVRNAYLQRRQKLIKE